MNWLTVERKQRPESQAPRKPASVLWLIVLCGVLASWSWIPGETALLQAADPPTTETAAPPAAPIPASDAPAHEGGGGGHTDPVAPVLLALMLILLAAKVGGDLFERVSLPAVLGELCVGVLLGNLWLAGVYDLEFLKPPERQHYPTAATAPPTSPTGTMAGEMAAAGTAPAAAEHHPAAIAVGDVLDILARIGVVLLLFQVGLESTVGGMMAVGASSFIVAILGVVAPMLLGYGVGYVMIGPAEWEVNLFLGATLSATSVGITARVLKDMGRSQQAEGRIILGAAVIDDVLGLIILAVVQGIILSGAIETGPVLIIILKAVGFLIGALVVGTFLVTRPVFLAASYLHGHNMLIATALFICFGFSWLANAVGLAPIVGAFAAGLILEKATYRELGSRTEIQLEHALEPLAAVFVPIFFVQMGLLVDLTQFAQTSVLGLAAGLTLAAIIGKQVCAWGALEKGLNRTAIGVGMIPRGEVGLIFAAIGQNLRTHNGRRVVDEGTYSAVVVMVMVTTLVTPPLLKWVMSRSPTDSVPPIDAGQPPSPSEDLA